MTTPANPDDLLARLHAQLDTDVRLIDEYEAYMTERSAAAGSYVLVTPPGWHPGEPFDPDRQRAEVDAKRRILDLYVLDYDADGRAFVVGGYGEAWLAILRLLALPHADREGFREEWRPA